MSWRSYIFAMPTIKIESPVRVPAKLSLEFGPGLAPPLPVSRESSRELSISPRPVPTTAVKIHLDWSVQAAELRAWEDHAADQAIEILDGGTATGDRLNALSKLARLGAADKVVEALKAISAAQAKAPQPFYELAKAQILAGDYDAAILSSVAARKNGWSQYQATDLQARAHLLQGASDKAASALQAAGPRHSVQTSHMVKFANGEADQKPRKFDPALDYTARDMAEYFAWRRDTGAVVAWLKRSILAGEYQEISELISSPFIAPIIGDSEFKELLAGLEIQLEDLPASKRKATTAQPSPSPRAGQVSTCLTRNWPRPQALRCSSDPIPGLARDRLRTTSRIRRSTVLRVGLSHPNRSRSRVSPSAVDEHEGAQRLARAAARSVRLLRATATKRLRPAAGRRSFRIQEWGSQRPSAASRTFRMRAAARVFCS